MKVRYLGGGYRGFGLKNSFLQKVIEATFTKEAPRYIYDDDDLYQLDRDLTIRTIRIYYCVEKKKCVISHSSTIVDMKELKQSVMDIKDDFVMFFLGAKHTSRYKVGYETQIEAEKKYNSMGYKIINVGYSLGSSVSKELGERPNNLVDEIIVYNRPVLLTDIGSDVGPETYEISTHNDIVSTLRPVENHFRPEEDLQNQTIFDSQTDNPFKAHSYHNLEHLPDDHYFGNPDYRSQNQPMKELTYTEKLKQAHGYGLNDNSQLIKDMKKMQVCQLKVFIKMNRPKGQTKKYPVTNKNKRELQIMAEQLISLKD